MSFNKITTSDLTNKGVSGLPDTPGLSTSEMQRKFDEIGKEVIVPKFNELVDELNKNGNVIKASDIVGIRVNANKQIEVTTDFNTWYATASSGHVIIDKNGNTLPQRGTMKFVGESLVYDDPENEQTVITAIQGAQGEEGPIGPVGPKGDRGQVYIPSIDEQGNISWTPADYTVPPAVRNIRGPQGVQGVQGPRGERGYNGKDGRSFSVLGQYESLEALQIAHPVGNEGDAYSVQLAEGNTIYLWDVDKREWVDIGSLQGPQGPQGEQGIQGIQGPPGIQGERGIPTSVNGLIGESIEVTPAFIPYTESKSLADLLGTTDISEIGDGTVTGSVKTLSDKATENEAAISEVNSKLGNTDISAIGDGTVTGGLNALNSNLGLINKKTFLWEISANQGSKQIDFSPFSYVLIMISISGYATQCMIVPTYLKSLSAAGIQTQVGLYSQNEYVYANITYDGTTFSFSSSKTFLFDVIGIQ